MAMGDNRKDQMTEPCGHLLVLMSREVDKRGRAALCIGLVTASVFATHYDWRMYRPLVS